jgi:hypothetical protein
MKKIVCLLLIVTSCYAYSFFSFNRQRDSISGSKKIVSKTIPLPAIETISLSTVGDCQIMQGDKDELTIIADNNIIEYVRHDISNREKKLSLCLSDGSFKDCTLKYKITLRQLPKLFQTSDSVTLNISHSPIQEQISIQGSAASSIKVDQIIFKSFVAKMSDAATLNASAADAARADIIACAAASCTIGNVDELNAVAHDAASIRYAGNPIINQHHADPAATIRRW